MGNYFTIAWRNLKQNASYTTINIGGLSLGIACALLIYTVVSHQLQFDNFHPDRDRIYRTVSIYTTDVTEYQSGVPQPLGKAFTHEFDFAEKAAMVNTYQDALISLPDRAGIKFEEAAGVAYAQPAFFDIFHFPLWKGDKNTVISSPNTAVITRNLAQKYFGTEDAIGKVIRYDNRTNFTITGILENIPSNTDRKQEIYLSYASMREKSAWLSSDSSWGSVRSSMNFFVRLKPGITAAQVNKAYPLLIKKYMDEEDVKTCTFVLQPLSDIHFNTTYDGYTDRKYLWALSLIGILLIVTACVNFINLATAQALKRAREVGVRKVLGSTRVQLFRQFMTETALICCFAALLAYGLAQLSMPLMNRLFGLRMSLSMLQHPSLLLFMVLLLIVVIFCSGFYPAIVLTRFQPVAALKGKLTQKHIGGFPLRRVLVIAQFGISQMLIIGSLVIMSQMRYNTTADMGFHKNGIVMVPLPPTDKDKQHTLRTRIQQLSGVNNISLCVQAPASSSNNYTGIRLNGEAKNRNWSVNMKEVDQQYATVFGLHFIAGGNFLSNDTLSGIILNENAVKKLGFTNAREAIGQVAILNGDIYTAPVTGVVKDFNNHSLRSTMEPVALVVSPKNYRNCAINLNMASAHNTLAAIDKIWSETFPNHLYKYEFLDDRLAKFYELDTIMLRFVQIFSLIAIFIGCLGLYGLIAFMAAQKNKEIGVRKVLGAHLADILWMFGRELAVLLCIAFVIAVPVAWWVMNRYLQEFSYRISIGPGIFVTAMLCSVGIAVFTAGYRSFKAAVLSPLKSLKAE